MNKLSNNNFSLDSRADTADKHFQALCDALFSKLRIDEILLLNYQAEISDFVRLNQNKIRQAGNVAQHGLKITFISGARQASASFHLCGELPVDLAQGEQLLNQLRQQLPSLPDDPYLNFADKPGQSIHTGKNTLPDPQETIEQIIGVADGLDLVGIWASGVMMRGFANSLGQRNWHSNYNFNFDWSIYHRHDKAIKQDYAGLEWQTDQFQKRIESARQSLSVLAKPAKTISPGQYRVFLTPHALKEILQLLFWGGFSLKSHRTLQTPLLRMIRANTQLNNRINLLEDQQNGLAPAFTPEGFRKPEQVSLIKNGIYDNCLANARSAREYGVEPNSSSESPQSLSMHGGSLHQDGILNSLDTGVYISNLWYGNYSDRNQCRMTGMTRFATLWVENGVPVAPLNVMRFDESLYNMLGDKLENLTQETELILDPSSYEQRSLQSMRVPGALVDKFTFTL